MKKKLETLFDKYSNKVNVSGSCLAAASSIPTGHTPDQLALAVVMQVVIERGGKGVHIWHVKMPYHNKMSL